MQAPQLFQGIMAQDRVPQSSVVRESIMGARPAWEKVFLNIRPGFAIARESSPKKRLVAKQGNKAAALKLKEENG
jgi:hypothetical protein